MLFFFVPADKEIKFHCSYWKRTEPYPEDINDLLLEETRAVILSDKSDFYEIDVENDNDHDFFWEFSSYLK